MMKAFTLTYLLFVLFSFSSTSLASPVLTSRAISSSLYDDLVRFTKYSSAAYQLLCPRPLGNTLVHSARSTRGFIARDDSRKEIVVSFRGSFSLADAATDVDVFLVPFISLGITQPFDVHSGFLAAYNDVADVVLTTVKAQLTNFPNHAVVPRRFTCSPWCILAENCPPRAALKLYTFGQPRTGDAQFAAFVESTIGSKIFSEVRAYHTIHVPRLLNAYRLLALSDGVPTMIPRALGYEHHATEYWQSKDPGLFTSPPTTVTKCVGPEDKACSDSIFSTGINPAHLFYFGQVMAVNPLLCI
ncbi:alpha/beta-hydrolase [Mycena leptocephala]|nr:alpha/beta-hydrolase [Mycena leptocephala]